MVVKCHDKKDEAKRNESCFINNVHVCKWYKDTQNIISDSAKNIHLHILV